MNTSLPVAEARRENLLDALNRPGVLPSRERAALNAWSSTFYPFQREWLFEPNRFAICNKSRQIGMSHTTAAAAVLWGVFLAETTSIISVGEREAIEVVEKARLHCAALDRLGSRWAKATPKAGQILLPHGGRVIALPASSGGRSFSGNVFLDEFAYVEHPKAVWDGAAGTVLHGYRMRVASTPNGVGNMFADLWSDPATRKGWATHAFPLKRALADGMAVDVDACWKMAKGDPRLFSQLFECSFLDNEQQYIPTELVDAATVDDVYCPEGDTFAGIDVGRTADLTALVVVRRDAVGVCWVVKLETRKRTRFEDLEHLVAVAVNVFRARRVSIDATGLGSFPAEQFQKRFGRQRIEPMTFTLNSKEELATTLYQRFAGRQVRIARADADLRDDVCALRRMITAAGNVRYDAPQTDKGHADRAWALALALYAASSNPSRKLEVHDHNEPRNEWT